MRVLLENDHYAYLFGRDSYIEEKLEGVDLSTMAGRIRHYRVKKGIGQLEMGRRLGMKDCRSYAKTYENQQSPANNLGMVKKICRILEVDEGLVYDSYLDFLSSDYLQKLKDLRGALGKTKKEMDSLLGNSCGLYGKWERGQQVPGRNSVRKILEWMDKI